MTHGLLGLTSALPFATICDQPRPPLIFVTSKKCQGPAAALGAQRMASLAGRHQPQCCLPPGQRLSSTVPMKVSFPPTNMYERPNVFQAPKVTIAANISVALTMSQALKHFTYSNSVIHHRRWHYYCPDYIGEN